MESSHPNSHKAKFQHSGNLGATNIAQHYGSNTPIPISLEMTPNLQTFQTIPAEMCGLTPIIESPEYGILQLAIPSQFQQTGPTNINNFQLPIHACNLLPECPELGQVGMMTQRPSPFRVIPQRQLLQLDYNDNPHLDRVSKQHEFGINDSAHMCEQLSSSSTPYKRSKGSNPKTRSKRANSQPAITWLSIKSQTPTTSMTMPNTSSFL